MMIDKMHTAMNKACEKANEITGVTIMLPKPSKRSLKISVFTNGLVGVGFILFGVMTPYKWIILLGALGLTSSILVYPKAK
ncbi:hypothetical protein KDN24_13365 [Bacillus sp. Bva_UNVM-123]|uniref:hypothetical protein n=1 Tax=Bacillus sp. Bva_UNVM-123 TaxID=2829798 RepID=UPI00391F2678